MKRLPLSRPWRLLSFQSNRDGRKIIFPFARQHASSFNFHHLRYNIGKRGVQTVPSLLTNHLRHSHPQQEQQHQRFNSPMEYSISMKRNISFESFSIWGASGIMLKAFHMNGVVPYYMCFVMTNILVRTALFPFVLQSSHTSVRFATVAPEIQFLVTIFQNDLKRQRQQQPTNLVHQWMLVSKTIQTMRALYVLHKINPLHVFISPLCQIPIFWYVSVDLRKIINGADPALAQQLTEGGIFWFSDLTDPDPWYALPVLSGLLLYYNVEVAVGKQALAGETASKSNMALILKDFFQSLAVLMPCFMAQSPAGMQIYLCTSFLFTLGQSFLLRNNDFRGWVGLPLVGASAAAPKKAKFAQEFIELKKLEHEARQARGDGPVLGTGVLSHGLEVSFAGTKRPSTIEGSPPQLLQFQKEQEALLEQAHIDLSILAPGGGGMGIPPVGNTPFIHGISAPPSANDASITEENKDKDMAVPEKPAAIFKEPSLDDMERANQGLAPVEFVKSDPSPPATKTASKIPVSKKKLARKRKKGRKR